MTANPADAVREALESVRDWHRLMEKNLCASMRAEGSSFYQRGGHAKMADKIDAALERLAALAGAAPDWVPVPREATLAMQNAVTSDAMHAHDAAAIYREMIAAAPHAPAKAREVTQTDVNVALKALWGQEIIQFGEQKTPNNLARHECMRAALATFAEGAE